METDDNDAKNNGDTKNIDKLEDEFIMDHKGDIDRLENEWNYERKDGDIDGIRHHVNYVKVDIRCWVNVPT